MRALFTVMDPPVSPPAPPAFRPASGLLASPSTGTVTAAASATAAAAAAAANDAEAAAAEFQAFYLRTSRALWAYLVAAGRDRALADDLLQESYLRLLQARGAPRNEEDRRRYLFRIASNLLADERRAGRRSVQLAPPGRDARDAGATGDGAPSGELHASSAPGMLGAVDPAAQGDTNVEISRALAELPAQQRRLLWLAHVEGWDHREIAAIVGVGATSVKVLLFRARKRLAALLGAATGTDARSQGARS